jgi:hypothetical protein
MPQACSDPAHIKKVALAILAYFRLHPRAKDTAEGIARWWVGEKKIAVKEALDLLMKEGVVRETRNHFFYSGHPDLAKRRRRSGTGTRIVNLDSRTAQ